MSSIKNYRSSQSSGGTSSAVVGKTLIYSGDINDNFVTFLWENLLKQGVDLWNKKSGAAKESRRLILSSAGGSPENVLSIVDLFEHSTENCGEFVLAREFQLPVRGTSERKQGLTLFNLYFTEP